jgi:uncharacterized protein YggE
MNEYTIVGIVVVIAVVVLCYYCSDKMNPNILSGEGISYNISADGTSKAKNDMMGSRISIKSKLHQSPDKSYESILSSVDKVRKLLESDKSIGNITIKTRIDPDWKYKKEGNKELLGHRSVSNISYDTKVGNGEQAIKATKLQNKIISGSTANAIINIDSMNYFMSDSKRTELEGEALKNAIDRGKHNANILVSNINPGRSYKITNVVINNSGGMSLPMRSFAAESRSADAGPNNVIAQGDSVVRASISMKVSVV